MSNANASSGDQFQDLAFPPDYPASVAFVLRKLKNQKDETDAVVNAVKARVTVLEGIAETLSGRMTAVETAAADRVKKSSIQSLDPSTVKLSPASIKEFLVTMVNAMKACLALALLVPALAFGGGKDIYGNDLARTNKLGYVDGDLTTVGDIADFGAASPSVITTVVEGIVHPWARAANPPAETDPTVPYWAKQVDPPAESDPTVKAWAKADNPPAETDPTVPAWAKAANPPASMPDNGLVLTNNGTTVKTKAGTEITAGMVGALSTDSRISDWPADIEVYDNYVASGKLVYDKAVRKGTSQYLSGAASAIGSQSLTLFYGDGSEVTFTPTVSETDPTVPQWAKYPSKPSYTASEVGAVPTTRKVNNKPLSSDITLGASDVGAVPATRTVNNKALSSNISLSASDVGAATPGYVDQQNEATRAIVQTWEGFLDGSNVVFSITNYISGSYSLDTAKLRILEMTNGVYREVYNTRDEIVMHITDFKTNDFATATNQVIASVDSKIAGKADKAWGKYTSTGGEAPSNTVVMTETYTKFAGGTEYYRFAVGEGSIAVLATKGAPAYTVGDEGTFKFQDDGGTNYFGFAKSDSYTLGCNADGISVSSGIVTIRYDVVMPNYPCVWYKASLEDNLAWEQLNLPDGTAIAGASHTVSWEQNPPEGQKLCYLNCSGEPSGFFKATIEVAGGAKFMTNMPADLGGGIICTNTATHVNGVIVPTYNGSQVIWTWRTL